MRSASRFALVVLLFSLFSGRAFGQGGATGAISGEVVDSSGASIADAEVQIIDSRTDQLARKVTSGSDGAFAATLLPPGAYYVVTNKSGFSQARADGIEVRVTETTRVTITLKPGQVSERVEISAQVTNVETTNATTGESIGTTTIRELPLATQNYQQLLSLSSGTSSELNASAQLGRGNVRIIVNGQREDNNNYLIEGISSTDYNVSQSTNVPLPNPDVIQEFKVQTSLYDASQGRNGGGNVNAILRSGSKGLHGDAYEYFRNDVLNANEYFLNAADAPRPPVKQNIFGASLGGPIGTEKFGFFFVNYQGSRQRSALSPGTQINNPGLPILPADRSAANLAAVFSTPATAPTVANPGGCPAVPITIDPVIDALMNFKSNQFGDPNGFLFPGVGNPADAGVVVDPDTCSVSLNTAPFLISRPGRYTDDQFTTNWDREFRGGQDKLSARFFFSDAESFLPFGAGGLQASLGGTLASSISAADLNFPFDLPVHGRFFSAAETHLFSPALVNEFRFGYVRINYSLLNIAPVTADDVGIDRPTSNITNSIYKFTQFGSAGFQFGPTPPADQFQTQNNYNFLDTVSWVRGAHIFRFGGEYTRVNLDKLFPQVFNGQLFFSNSPGSPGTTPSDSVGGLTDFQTLLEGAPGGSFGGGGVFNHRYRTNDFAVFAQDDWKIRPDLTLNLGLRLEELGAFRDDACHIGNIDQDLAASGQYPFIYGGCVTKLNLPGLSPTGSGTTYKNNYTSGWGPRIGLAYDLFGHHNTTIRSGYGIYYVREDVGTADQLSFNGPFLPIAFGGGQPGCLGSFFSARPLPGCPDPNGNALPPAGTLDPNFVPCLGAFQGFSGPTSGAPDYACSGTGPGVIPSQFLFGLVVPRKFVAPNTQQWNLTIQRSLGHDWVLELGYIGTHAVHLRETRTIGAQLATADHHITVVAQDGTPYEITESTVANGPARSPNPGINFYNGMQIFADDAYSHYHSLQATASRRWGAGYFQAAYTFSRSTDATSSGNTALNTAFNNEVTLDDSRGLSDFDRTHRFVVSYRYELPFFKDAEGWKRAALSGWALSGITIFQSGRPFSVLDGSAGSAFIGGGLQSPTSGAQLVDGGTINAGLTHGDIHSRVDNGYLNIDNFTFAPPADPAGCDLDPTKAACTTAFGNLGRNIYRGPFQQNWDFSLLKNFRITERQQLRFTADFFNIWNHANFDNPTFTDISNPAFGKIFSTVGTPRLIQFSLRYAF